MNQVIQSRIEALREQMRDHQVDYYLVPTADFHNSENVGAHYQSRAYITGFTGSAGTAVIGLEEAGLWTDARYFIQAEQVLAGTGVTLYKMGVEGVPTLADFLRSRLEKGQAIAFDGRCVTANEGLAYQELAHNLACQLKTDLDLIGAIWQDRPPLSKAPVVRLGEAYAGESSASKFSRLREVMKASGAHSHLITSLDDIGWLLNLRGGDVEFYPLMLSYLCLDQLSAVLYVDESKLNNSIKEYLRGLGVSLAPYDAIYEEAHNFESPVLLDLNQVNHVLFQQVLDQGEVIDRRNPTIEMKAIKNDIELANMHQAQVKDGVAHVKFAMWLEERIQSGRIEEESELSASAQLDSYRQAQGDYWGPSFEPIAAYGANGANNHYSPDETSNQQLYEGNLLLMDTGANYLQGSTDITRTFALGQVPQAYIDDYTLVLMANLRLTAARFIQGATGMNVDYAARQVFWERGLDFKHGTGHGVGYLGNIHEPPIGIRWQYRPNETVPFQEGHVVTNEPGLYYAGSHGIRLENELVVRKGDKTEFGQFMYFQVFSFVPFDHSLINVDLMTCEDLALLNEYHEIVYQELVDALDTESERQWLRQATLPI